MSLFRPEAASVEAIEARVRLTAVARGEAQADLLVRGGRVVNVLSGEILEGDVAVYEGRFAYVGRKPPRAKETLDAQGLFLAPGFIEPHAHPWVLYNPVSVAGGILPGGTTAAFNDDLFFFHLGGEAGLVRMLDALRDARLPINYWWLVRLVSQADWPGEAAHYDPTKIARLLDRPDVAGTAEVTRWPLVWGGEPRILAEIAQSHARGKRADGHTAGASYDKLNAIAAGGITACHEAITAQQILDRLRVGLWTVMRHSSLRPDLPELVRAVTEQRVDTRRLMLTADGPAPAFIAGGGFVNRALRECVALGVPPVTAIQMATVNPATYYRLDDELGAVAPGRRADLVLLPDLKSFDPVRVFVSGREVARDGKLAVEMPEVEWSSLGMAPHFAPGFDFGRAALYRPWKEDEALPVIAFQSNVITEAGTLTPWVKGAPPEGTVLGALLDREAKWATRAFLKGFAPRLDGLASTYNTTTHLLVAGRDPASMALCAQRARQLGGGIVVAERGEVAFELALPIAGMMSPLPFAGVVAAQRRLDAKLREAGFPFDDLLYALLFLCCDFLPGWRLVPPGVFDVKAQRIVRAAEELPER